MTGTDTQVIRLAVEGLTAKQIAYKLNLTERQAERHLLNVRHELGAKNTTEAVSKYLQSEWRAKRGRKIPSSRGPGCLQLSLPDGTKSA